MIVIGNLRIGKKVYQSTAARPGDKVNVGSKMTWQHIIKGIGFLYAKAAET